MIAKVDLGADSYGNEHVVPSRTITRKGVVRNYRSLPVKTKNGLVQLKVRVGLRGGGGVVMGVSGMVFVGLVLGCIDADFCK